MSILPKLKKAIFEIKFDDKTYQFRRMTGGDEKTLLFAKQSRDTDDYLLAMKQVVNNCCQSPTFDVDSIAAFELEYAFLKIRSASVSNISEINITDGEDGLNYPISINLDEVEIDWTNKRDNLIKVDDEIGILLKYPSASLYGDKTLSSAEDGMFELILRCIDKIYDGDSVISVSNIKPKELAEWVEKLEINVYDKIKDFFYNIPTLSYRIVYTNSAGKEKEVWLRSLSDFFIF